MLEFASSHPVATALLAVVFALIGRFFARAYVLRRRYRNLVHFILQRHMTGNANMMILSLVHLIHGSGVI